MALVHVHLSNQVHGVPTMYNTLPSFTQICNLIITHIKAFFLDPSPLVHRLTATSTFTVVLTLRSCMFFFETCPTPSGGFSLRMHASAIPRSHKSRCHGEWWSVNDGVTSVCFCFGCYTPTLDFDFEFSGQEMWFSDRAPILSSNWNMCCDPTGKPCFRNLWTSMMKFRT